MVTKVNPTATTTNYEVIGKEITFFTVDYINAINGSAGPAGAQVAVLNTIMNVATIIAVGPLLDSNTQQTFAVERDLSSTELTAIENAIKALGTYDSVNLASATVTATKLGILTAAAVS